MIQVMLLRGPTMARKTFASKQLSFVTLAASRSKSKDRTSMNGPAWISRHCVGADAKVAGWLFPNLEAIIVSIAAK
jgi:hypothetical protein